MRGDEEEFTACVGYNCKLFGPPLTQYLRENKLIDNPDGTLKQEGFDLFCILNQLMIRTFHGSKDSELQDALLYYNENKTWPNWLTDKAYQDYIYGRKIFQKNPRLTIIESGETQESSPVPKSLFRRIITIFQVNK
ncbi:hypothetical protein KBD33_04215 [Candidatus Gracilibacteria bacterium]|nr:hypothetical protein [Candidatus Gracilibacteria bacterium]